MGHPGDPAKNIWVPALRSTFPKTHMEPQQFHVVQMIRLFQIFRDILRFRFFCTICVFQILCRFVKEFLFHWGPRSMLDQLVRSRLQQVWGWNSNCTLGLELSGRNPRTRLVRCIHNYTDIHVTTTFREMNIVLGHDLVAGYRNSCHHFCKHQLGGLRLGGTFLKAKTFLRPWHHKGRFVSLRLSFPNRKWSTFKHTPSS